MIDTCSVGRVPSTRLSFATQVYVQAIGTDLLPEACHCLHTCTHMDSLVQGRRGVVNGQGLLCKVVLNFTAEQPVTPQKKVGAQ